MIFENFCFVEMYKIPKPKIRTSKTVKNARISWKQLFFKRSSWTFDFTKFWWDDFSFFHAVIYTLNFEFHCVLYAHTFEFLSIFYVKQLEYLPSMIFSWICWFSYSLSHVFHQDFFRQIVLKPRQTRDLLSKNVRFLFFVKLSWN